MSTKQETRFKQFPIAWKESSIFAGEPGIDHMFMFGIRTWDRQHIYFHPQYLGLTTSLSLPSVPGIDNIFMFTTSTLDQPHVYVNISTWDRSHEELQNHRSEFPKRFWLMQIHHHIG
ncbi:hypothetical protein RRG08_059309 [Elysia crispata]|uniref:Uncharacterized protein n=1 Tax=Elysia crispata TaxID=231223 RepID=A0AAE0ZCR0_9GAST|nr:hypothetical protein RRG08_059309 [Elysia crispata]